MKHLPVSLSILRGRSHCVLYPEMGGGLARWIVDSQDMLRIGQPEAIVANGPLALSSFPLVPFSNRIGKAMFEWAGSHHQLAQNFLPEPHAIHGVGWQMPWTIATRTDASITLSLFYAGGERWPWPFEAVQIISVTEDTLSLELSARNLAAEAVPLAFGHHPYFDQAGASLQFQAERIWMSGTDGLPTVVTTPKDGFDFSSPRPVKNQEIDHCYAGWFGSATIKWQDRPYALEINASPALKTAVLYIPKDGDAFCFEPVPNINNALNLVGHEPSMPVIAPGEIFKATIFMQAIKL